MDPMVNSEKAYMVLENETLGRYAVAARDLAAGEEVLTESAAVVGPKHHSPPVCLGCLARTTGRVTCSRCGWPVCGADCEQLPAHRDAECSVFAAAGLTFGPPPADPELDCPQLECITPLRLLLTTGGDRWREEVSLMESHENERRATLDWAADEVNIVGFLRSRCATALQQHLGGPLDEPLLHKVCGILAVNAFEAYSRTENGDNAVRALYPQLALLAHSCVPNTSHSVGSDYRVHVRTTVPVAQGAPLFSTYTHTLDGTLTRRRHLRLGKYFECDCSRCRDPAELGAHLSTFKCHKCELGWLVAEKPLEDGSDWQCERCDCRMPGAAVAKVLEVLQREAEALEPDDLEGREVLLKKYRGSLHPRHAHLTGLKLALSRLYGRVQGYTFSEVPDVLLERKVELCRHVLAVADIVEPGFTRIRGMTLYELHAPLLMLARSQFQQGVLTGSKLLERMREAEDTLAEAVNILALEEQDSAEGQLAMHARTALEQLRETIRLLPQQLGLQ